MRRDLFPLDSEKHRDKMAVVNFIKDLHTIIPEGYETFGDCSVIVHY